ncbi:MAG: hypothetical protein K0U74_14185 [Alphaproteobacteria bacterium]|nr:hypothetical protein [Alphaproteobacteria bacterium]
MTQMIAMKLRECLVDNYKSGCLTVAGLLLTALVIAWPVHWLYAQEVTNERLRIVSWNIRTLSEPARVFDDQLLRTSDQLAKLSQFALKLDGDVYALQEVGSLSALAQIFPLAEFDICISGQYFQLHPELGYVDDAKCFSSGPLPGTPKSAANAWQFPAFAVKRRRSSALAVTDYRQIGVMHRDTRDNQVRPTRWGLILNLSLDGGNLQVINLHLKSRCRGHPWQRRKFDEHCGTFARQARELSYLRNRLLSRSIVVGDFNRPMDREDKFAEWFVRSTKLRHLPLQGAEACALAQARGYTQTFDHVLIGNGIQEWDATVKFAAPVKVVEEVDQDKAVTFGDHCPIVLDVERAR